MKWINKFSESQIPYYIYKLNKGDQILYKNTINYNNCMIILNGVLCILKTFNNKKIFTIAILSTNDSINLKYFNINIQYYYKLIALEKTYIISFSLINKLFFQQDILLNIINNQELTLKKYEMMNYILSQKYIKYRIIQTILLLCIEYGIIYKKKVIIPFPITQKNLALIIGSNKVTVNKLINYLSNNTTIKYSTKKIIYIQNIQNINSIFYC